MLLLGNRLSAATQAEVLRAFVYRWTSDNRQRTSAYKCALCDIRTPYVNSKSSEGHTHPTVPLTTDAEWLASHAFYVTKNGRLDARYNRAEPAFLADS